MWKREDGPVFSPFYLFLTSSADIRYDQVFIHNLESRSLADDYGVENHMFTVDGTKENQSAM